MNGIYLNYHHNIFFCFMIVFFLSVICLSLLILECIYMY
ncbi:hypothetical protein [Plasmodium yoelii yoelii]|uniref:Uncharacterized protein n=1 Tax=Plasmodium yoelii yoelii TaxID=73239 RepID=Q7R8L2_PLAYO|nr:hypothetical protein [Plasmodium yoelii yoelii]